MCTMIAERIEVEGCAKRCNEWMALDHSYVTYDHPFNLAREHALNIDFVNVAQGPGARVAVELTADSARALVRAILAALDEAERVDAA